MLVERPPLLARSHAAHMLTSFIKRAMRSCRATLLTTSGSDCVCGCFHRCTWCWCLPPSPLTKADKQNPRANCICAEQYRRTLVINKTNSQAPSSFPRPRPLLSHTAKHATRVHSNESRVQKLSLCVCVCLVDCDLI